MIKVLIPSAFKKTTRGAGEATFEAVEIPTVRAMIARLDERHPGLSGQILDSAGGLQRFVNIFVNGLDVRFIDGLDSALADGDEVQIVPAIAGGAGTRNAESGMRNEWDRYSRQVILPEVGGAGQKKIEAASVELTGDPSVVEIAGSFLRAAGVGSVTIRSDGAAEPGRGLAKISSGGRSMEIPAGAGADRAGVGGAGIASPVASQFSLKSAGLLLAIESLKAIVGMEPSAWSIGVD